MSQPAYPEVVALEAFENGEATAIHHQLKQVLLELVVNRHSLAVLKCFEGNNFRDGGVGTVGITAFAAKALGDIVFVELPEVGDVFEAGDSFGSVESVKAASDVYSPVAGEVVEINETLTDTPGLLNEDPMGKGWFMKVKLSEEVSGDLLDPAAYQTHCDGSG